MKYRILSFNDYYIPSTKAGGPVRSMKNAVDALHNEFDFYIECYDYDFGCKGQRYSNIKDGWQEVGFANVIYQPYGTLDFKYKNMEMFIREVSPDVIWFQGLLMPHKVHNAIRVAEKMGIPTIISPRGEASPDRMALKGYKKYPYAVLCNLLGIYHKENVFFHATSDDEVVGLKKFFKAKQDRIYQIGNIPVAAAENPVFISKQKDSIRIMFVSRIHEVKNILLAVQIVKKLKCKAIFDIYGPIESKDYWNLCLKEMEHLPRNIQINYCGLLPMDQVGKTFQNYDAFLFPTINENYGHVIAEALANGCPTVLSKGTTPWDDLDGVAGYTADLKNENEFKMKLEKLALLDEEDYTALRKSTIEYFKRKQDEKSAIAGHAQMFIDVIQKMEEKRIVKK